MKKFLYLLSCLFCFTLFFQQEVHAQNARLGIQGILKKANGNAVDDGAYSLRFRLYEQAEGGMHIWEETQPDVEVVGGIYTATLGSVAPLNAPFNTTYYLGVSVGSTSEMLPRIQLTTAPYALALIGNTNQFPSSGLVQADDEVIAGKLAVGQTTLPTNQSVQVNGGILARGGAPAVNGANNNGYAFSGNSGDNDSGLFSTTDGRVSLYANNTERLRASTTGVEITGNLTSNTATLTVDDDLNLTAGKSVQYNGIKDWRLVRRDEFHTGNDGWFCTTALDNNTSANIERIALGTFNGPLIRPSTSNDHFLKKEFDLSDVGPYFYIMLKFKYYHTDSWDSNDTGIGGFCTTDTGANANICWMNTAYVYSTQGKANYTGNTSYSDGASYYQMLAYYPSTTSTSFHVFFGMRSGESINNERYGLGNVEVWVR